MKIHDEFFKILQEVNKVKNNQTEDVNFDVFKSIHMNCSFDLLDISVFYNIISIKEIDELKQLVHELPEIETIDDLTPRNLKVIDVYDEPDIKYKPEEANNNTSTSDNLKSVETVVKSSNNRTAKENPRKDPKTEPANNTQSQST